MTDYKENLEIQQNYYNNTAEQYDNWHVNIPSALVVNNWNLKNLKSYLDHKSIKNCLDLGCGTGRLSKDLLTISSEVYGLDASEEILKVASKKYSQTPNLKWFLGEVTNIPFSNDFFDLVVVNGALHHFFALPQVCKEINRVLKPGGVFAILGEPNKNYNKYNFFWYTFIAYRIWVKIIGIFKRNKLSEDIEPDAENFDPKILKKTLVENKFMIDELYSYDYGPRLNNKIWLKNYNRILVWEHKILAKLFPLQGSALQIFCRKK